MPKLHFQQPLLQSSVSLEIIMMYIINVFNVTFDQFNASLLDKSINFFFLNLRL